MTPRNDKLRQETYPMTQEQALGKAIREHEKLESEIEWLWKNCQIIHWPEDGEYPIEHNPYANKNSRDIIQSLMPNDEN